jgi:hypothetical protein
MKCVRVRVRVRVRGVGVVENGCTRRPDQGQQQLLVPS